MIEYLHLRFPPGQTGGLRVMPENLWPQPLTWWQPPRANSSKEVADALCKVALELKPTSYPAIRKFYANRRAVQELYNAYGSKADPRVAEQVGGTATYLTEILDDPTVPVEEAYDVCAETLAAYAGVKDVGKYDSIYQGMEQRLFARWRKDYRPWLLKGSAHVRMAWICRCGGYANTVTKEGWKGFEAHLRTAEEALAQAWKLNPKNILSGVIGPARVSAGRWDRIHSHTRGGTCSATLS